MKTLKCEHPSDDDIFMEMANVFANKSHCISQKVGCIAVIDGCPIAMGRNGTVKGEMNCCEAFEKGLFTREEHHEWSNKFESHAEINMLKDATRRGVSLVGSTIYCTLQPCQHCSKALTDIGIKRVVYNQTYDKTPPEATKVLESSGVMVQSMNDIKN